MFIQRMKSVSNQITGLMNSFIIDEEKWHLDYEDLH